ncbi:MAG: hypothetical protein ACUVXG_13505 [Anaerolineae bacterium]
MGKRDCVVGLFLCGLMLSGCAQASPTPTPDLVATQVAVVKAAEATLTASAPTPTLTLTATDTPRPTPTPRSTATPTTPPTATSTDTPRPTATRTPTRTPRPTPAIPAGWDLYKDPFGRFSVGIPSGFSLTGQTRTSATFQGTRFNFYVIGVGPVVYLDPDQMDKTLDGFLAEQMGAYTTLDFRLIDKGVIDEPDLRAVYVEYELYDRIRKMYSMTYSMAMPIPLMDGFGALLMYGRAGTRSLGENERTMMIDIAKTLQVDVLR